MGYSDHPEYVWVMFVTVAIDAFVAIPMAYLRYLHKPVKFASIQIFNIALNIVLNLLYLIVLPALEWNPFGIYDSQFTLEVVWVFYINIFCSFVKMLLLWKELQGIRFGFDRAACKRMLSYAWPLLVMGLAGQLNQAASQILFPYFYDGSTEEAHTELGIYGACIKIAMTFLAVIGYIDILRDLLIGESYWEGLRVVPIVMAAEIMFGIFFNLSFWYKLTDRTIWGAYFSGIGAVVLIVIDILFIPRFSYMACAWAGFAAYGVSMVISYFAGQKYFPVNYPLKSIAFYFLIAAVLFALMTQANAHLPIWAALLVNTLLLLVFVAVIIKRDNCWILYDVIKPA